MLSISEFIAYMFMLVGVYVSMDVYSKWYFKGGKKKCVKKMKGKDGTASKRGLNQ